MSSEYYHRQQRKRSSVKAAAVTGGVFVYNVLIIEESRETAGIVKELILETVADTRIIVAIGREEVEETLKTYDIDLITLNLMIPEAQTVFENLMEEEIRVNIPVIVNASAKDMQCIQQALDNGATDYFIRSLDRQYMKMILGMVMNNTLSYYENKRELRSIHKNMDNQFKIAGLLQKSMLSIHSSKSTEELEIHSCFRPAQNISSTLFDFKRIDRKNWIFMVDSKGNHMIQLMVSMLLKAVFNEGINRSDSPSEIMNDMNRRLHGLYPDMEVPFASCFVGKLENRILTYASAGFPNPEILSLKAEETEVFAANTHMLGFDEDVCYKDDIHVLSEGDCLLIHTDGLYRNNEEEDFDPQKAMRDCRPECLGEKNLSEIMQEVLKIFVEEESKKRADFAAAILRIR